MRSGQLMHLSMVSVGGGGGGGGGGGVCNVTDYDIRQVQPPFHTVGNNYLSVVKRVTVLLSLVVDKCYPATQTGRTVSSDQVQMDALILTVELAYHEILSIEHTDGLDYQRR